MIDIQNLVFHYPRKPPLFEHLDWQLASGRIAGCLAKTGRAKQLYSKFCADCAFPPKATAGC